MVDICQRGTDKTLVQIILRRHIIKCQIKMNQRFGIVLCIFIDSPCIVVYHHPLVSTSPIVFQCRLEDTDIRGINIVLVQRHCMKKGVFRTQFSSIQARSINGPHSRQGTVWPWLNIRLDIFKFCHYRVPMARRQSNHPQQKNSRKSIHIISFLGIINKKAFGDFCKSKFSLCKS